MTDLPNARWRTARKEHRCSAYWTNGADGPGCLGTGRIAAGSRYLDTGELADPARFQPFRCCGICANAVGHDDTANAVRAALGHGNDGEVDA
jgi:hypothetical protein